MSLLTLSSSGPLARAMNRFTENRAAVFGLLLLLPTLFVVLSYSVWLPFKPNDIDLLAMNAGPSWKHLFGTDGVGRDVLARTLEGGRISLFVAAASVVLSTSIGFIVGALAAFGGRAADAVFMRSVDLAMTLPPVIFLLVLASIVGSGIWSTVIVIALLSWPVLSRMIRARLLELREREFVVAAKGMGAGLGHLLFRHGLPNSIDILVVSRSPTPSCWRQACRSLGLAFRHPPQAGATCSTPPVQPPCSNNIHGNGCFQEVRWCSRCWPSTSLATV
jgi:peptide/nickel transport system permease protein